MTTEMKELVVILGVIDAIHLAPRNFDGLTARNQYQRRRLYAAGQGVLWAEPGGSDSDHRELSRVRAKLQSDDLIHKIIRRGSRATAVALTPKGDDLARQSCDLATLWMSLGMAGEILKMKNDPRGSDERGFAWIPETVLAGVAYEQSRDEDVRQRLIKVEEILLPSITCGWVTHASDVGGRVWYAVTDDGIKAIADDDVDEPAPIKADPAARDLYYSTLNTNVTALASAGLPDSREIGPLPFSASPKLRGSAK